MTAAASAVLRRAWGHAVRASCFAAHGSVLHPAELDSPLILCRKPGDALNTGLRTQAYFRGFGIAICLVEELPGQPPKWQSAGTFFWQGLAPALPLWGTTILNGF